MKTMLKPFIRLYVLLIGVICLILLACTAPFVIIFFGQSKADNFYYSFEDWYGDKFNKCMK